MVGPGHLPALSQRPAAATCVRSTASRRGHVVPLKPGRPQGNWPLSCASLLSSSRRSRGPGGRSPTWPSQWRSGTGSPVCTAGHGGGCGEVSRLDGFGGFDAIPLHFFSLRTAAGVPAAFERSHRRYVVVGHAFLVVLQYLTRVDQRLGVQGPLRPGAVCGPSWCTWGRGSGHREHVKLPAPGALRHRCNKVAVLARH